MTFPLRRASTLDPVQKAAQRRPIVLDDYDEEVFSLGVDVERESNSERTLTLLTELSNKTNLILRAMAQEHDMSAAETRTLLERCTTLEAENEAMKDSILVPRAKSFEVLVVVVSLLILGFSLSVLILTPGSTLAAFGIATAGAGLLPALLSIRRRA